MLREITEINMDNITTGDCIELFECKNTRAVSYTHLTLPTIA